MKKTILFVVILCILVVVAALAYFKINEFGQVSDKGFGEATILLIDKGQYNLACEDAKLLIKMLGDITGVKPEDITSIDDLHKLPFLAKSDLRDAYPYGLLATPLEDCVRIHSTSGTTRSLMRDVECRMRKHHRLRQIVLRLQK